MSVDVINPDSAILGQVQEHWQKIAAMLVWKLAREGVTLRTQDFASFPVDGTLLTFGHTDSIEFKIVTRAEAERIAAHDAATHRGRA